MLLLVGLEKEVFRGKEPLRSFDRTLPWGCWWKGGCWEGSPEAVPGRDLDEEPKKEKTFWVAEADFGIMVAEGDLRGSRRIGRGERRSR